MNDDRNRRIKKYGSEIVENDEKTWKKRGYNVDKNTGFLTQNPSKPAKRKALSDKKK